MKPPITKLVSGTSISLGLFILHPEPSYLFFFKGKMMEEKKTDKLNSST